MIHEEHLTTNDLARRWRLHPKTLSNWRVKDQGPAWIKLGGPRGKVLYRLEDVILFESNGAVSSWPTTQTEPKSA